jgi:asparagine synthase (glutamine-hydrolysing)
MANFLALVDPDRERRSDFLERITPLLPPFGGLVTQSCVTGDFAAVWAAHPTAPISWHAHPTGAAVVWGEAIVEGTAERVQARALEDLWGDQPIDERPVFDGFYAALVYHPRRGLVVGADLLGMFPVYYYRSDEIALVASSPDLFRYHPSFRAQLSRSGLIGILLTNGTFDGMTLWRDVFRLGAGNLLDCHPATEPRELNRYRLTGFGPTDRNADLPIMDQLTILHQTIDRALERHASRQHRHALLLSGGLDSRMLAGYLTRHQVPLTTLTLGIGNDIEMRCADVVSRALSLDHHRLDIPYAEYGAHTDQLVRWEHLANGCNNAMNWGIAAHLPSLAPRVVTGHALDAAVGGPLPVLEKGEELSYELSFQRTINNWGLAPALLERLCRREMFNDLPRDMSRRIQARYESYAETDVSRMWLFEMHHRQRLHVGSAAWQLSFGAWPVVIALDRSLLEIPARLSLQSLANRMAQKQLLCREFPHLARLPLDRNDFDSDPLLPTRARERLQRLRVFGLQRRWRKLVQRMGHERRYYHRIYDINGPGWKLVREHAESHRQAASALFDQTTFRELLPDPSVRIRFAHDPIIEASGLKLLLGFLLWSKDHL